MIRLVCMMVQIPLVILEVLQFAFFHRVFRVHLVFRDLEEMLNISACSCNVVYDGLNQNYSHQRYI